MKARRAAARRAGLAGLLGAVALGCGLGDDFAEELVDKTAKRNQERLVAQQREELPLPDPEEVPYRHVSVADLAPAPGFEVALVPELALSERGGDPNYVFASFAGGGRPSIAVDRRDRIYVLETRVDEVRVYEPDGSFAHRFGRPGEGPGDLNRPAGLVIAGNEVLVLHRRFFASVWSLDGEYLREASPFYAPEDLAETDAASARRFRRAYGVHGLADGSLVTSLRAPAPADRTGRIVTPFVRVIGRFLGGVEATHYAAVPEWAGGGHTVGPDGSVYVSMFGHLATEHYIVAFAADGSPRWAVVTPWDEEVPTRALLRVDGDGRLFVFPEAPAEADALAVDGDRYRLIRRPVQVYAVDGTLVGSGFLNERTAIEAHWQVSHGDRVYGIDENRETTEYEPTVYRLVVTDSG